MRPSEKEERANLVPRVFVPLDQRSETERSSRFLTTGQGEQRLWERDWKRAKMDLRATRIPSWQ